MFSEEEQIKTITFFQALDNVLNGQNFDLGLVVTNRFKAEDFLGLIPPKATADIFTLTTKEHPDDAILQIVESFKSNKWFILELQESYMPSQLYGQLRSLSVSNRLDIQNLLGSDEKEMIVEQPKESRVVVITTNEIAEKLGNQFKGLFGPVLNI